MLILPPDVTLPSQSSTIVQHCDERDGIQRRVSRAGSALQNLFTRISAERYGKTANLWMLILQRGNQRRSISQQMMMAHGAPFVFTRNHKCVKVQFTRFKSFGKNLKLLVIAKLKC